MPPTSLKERFVPRRPTSARPLALPVVVALVLMSLTTLPAAAQSFQEELTRADGLLRQGSYAEALEVSGPLVAEVAPQIVVPGGEGEGALGMLLAVHALAQAGVSQEAGESQQGGDPNPSLFRQATFHWTLAQSLEPALAKSTLAAYGAAGARLAAVRVDDACRLRPPLPDGLPEPLKVGESKLIPPRKVRSPAPQYTPRAREAKIEGAVILRAVVDREGRVRYPCVLDTDSPVFVYMLAEAVKDWHFEPALVDSRPVPVYYELSTRFTLDR